MIKRRDYLSGGRADNRDYDKFDQEQLRMGRDVEMEHTNDPDVSREIAGDHLTEIDDYYTRLAIMESEAESEDRYVVKDDDDVFVGITGNEKLVIGIRTADGNYSMHEVSDDGEPVNKPVKVRDYNRETGHVQEHYRRQRMR